MKPIKPYKLKKHERKVKEKYNFKPTKNGNLNHFFDRDHVVSLFIFKSGWENYYHCILEWGEYTEVEHHLYSLFQIQNIYSVQSFVRKEKLKKLS